MSDLATLHLGGMKSSIHNFDAVPNPEAECKRKCLKWTGISVLVLLLLNGGIALAAYLITKKSK